MRGGFGRLPRKSIGRETDGMTTVVADSAANTGSLVRCIYSMYGDSDVGILCYDFAGQACYRETISSLFASVMETT